MPNISETREVFNDVLNLDDHNLFAADFALCTLMQPQLSGSMEMVFGCLVGPPGCGKSEILGAMLGCHEITRELDHMSTRAFISGFIDKEHPDADHSLLPKLDKKTAINDDFLSLASGDPRKVEELSAQLHSGFKGRSRKDFGTGEKSYDSRFALMVASTPVIDTFFIKVQKLGGRFLTFRFCVPPHEYKSLIRDAVRSHATVGTWRQKLQGATRDLLMPRLADLPSPTRLLSSCTPIYEEKLIRMSEFAARARSLPIINMGNSRHWLAQEAEVGTRMAKQLHVLTATRTWLDGRSEWNDEDIGFMQRLAWDTIPALSHRIIETLHRWPGITREQINDKTFSNNVNLQAVMGQYVINRLANVQDRKYTLTPETMDIIDTVWESNPCLDPAIRKTLMRRKRSSRPGR